MIPAACRTMLHRQLATKTMMRPGIWSCRCVAQASSGCLVVTQAAKARGSTNSRKYSAPGFEESVARAGLAQQRSEIRRNASPAQLYEDALRFETGTAISSTGALIARSGAKAGRSPRDKRVVEEASTVDDVWWGPVNKKLSEESFA
ncbi:Protein kinase C-like 1, partial [Coemansia sp. RSA 1933]